MATTDCVIPISGLTSDGTATLCGVMTSPSEILLTPVLAQNENGLFAVTTPSTTFLSHLKPHQVGYHHGSSSSSEENKTVKFVQFVLNGSPSSPPRRSPSISPPKGRIRVIPEAAIRKTPTPPPSAASSNTINESCTICGQHYVDRSAFNAHIKLHLKEKLHIRRNKRKLEEEGSGKADKVPKGSSPREDPPAKSKFESGNSDVIMAELAACQPVPPEAITGLNTPPPNPLIFPPTPASSVCSAPSPAKPSLHMELLPQDPPSEASEEPSGVCFNMVMNKMDINYDLNNILDEIEQNLDPLHFERFKNNIHSSQQSMDTPPDSDAEVPLVKEEVRLSKDPEEEDDDKVDLDKLVSEAISSSSLRACPPSQTTTMTTSQVVIQSPSSIAKVGALPPKALAVLNQLPSKLFGSSDATGNRFINVVKIERSGGSEDLSNTIINIQCQNSKNNKIIESYRAIDTGKELKLIPNTRSGSPRVLPISEAPSLNNTNSGGSPAASSPIKNCSSECSICGKTITTKNMARHMEKHTGKKKFQCNICFASFFQKTHLKNHIALHKSGGIDKPEGSKGGGSIPSISPSSETSSFRCPICSKSFVQKGHLNRHLKSSHGQRDESSGKDLECKVCRKKCKNKVCLNRHRTKHMVCSHCNAKGKNLFFSSKLALQEHLLQFHPEAAVLSVENYNSSSQSPSSSSSSEEDNPVLSERDDTFLDYSSSSIKDEKLPTDFNIFNDKGSSSGSSVNLGPAEEEEEEEEEPRMGASIADISNSDYFDFNQELKEFYLTDLF